jgi:hypothetical protein
MNVQLDGPWQGNDERLNVFKALLLHFSKNRFRGNTDETSAGVRYLRGRSTSSIFGNTDASGKLTGAGSFILLKTAVYRSFSGLRNSDLRPATDGESKHLQPSQISQGSEVDGSARFRRNTLQTSLRFKKIEKMTRGNRSDFSDKHPYLKSSPVKTYRQQTLPAAHIEQAPPKEIILANERMPGKISNQIPKEFFETQAHLERLTDQIMRKIDRRMQIWRERTGRV